MAINTKLIKRRLKSVRSTKKITKAMELVAAAKMRRTVSAAVNARAFALLAEEMITGILSARKTPRHILTESGGPKTILFLITPNRGLCGGLNANLLKTLIQLKEPEPVAVILGKKGEAMVKKMGWPILAAFGALSDTPKWSELWPAVKLLRQEYAKGSYAKVVLVYTEFISALEQKPRARQVLPLSLDKDFKKPEAIVNLLSELKFEPSPEAVLDVLLPRLLEIRVYQACLEASASEQSARMLAMRNAGEAAEEMINDLVFSFNQARQAGITREIAEVAGGAAALAT